MRPGVDGRAPFGDAVCEGSVAAVAGFGYECSREGCVVPMLEVFAAGSGEGVRRVAAHACCESAQRLLSCHEGVSWWYPSWKYPNKERGFSWGEEN